MRFLKLITILLAMLFLSACRHFMPTIHTPPGSNVIPACGGIYMSINNFTAEPYYLQGDPAWKNDTIGGSNETISNVGCTLCCASMALYHQGIYNTPRTLNAILKNNEGYTPAGWLKWDVIESISKGYIIIDELPKPRYEDIDNALKSGASAIVKIKVKEPNYHWVLVVGKYRYDYIVKNPGASSKTQQSLSALSKQIYAVRIMRKNIPPPQKTK